MVSLITLDTQSVNFVNTIDSTNILQEVDLNQPVLLIGFNNDQYNLIETRNLQEQSSILHSEQDSLDNYPMVAQQLYPW